MGFCFYYRIYAYILRKAKRVLHYRKDEKFDLLFGLIVGFVIFGFVAITRYAVEFMIAIMIAMSVIRINDSEEFTNDLFEISN